MDQAWLENNGKLRSERAFVKMSSVRMSIFVKIYSFVYTGHELNKDILKDQDCLPKRCGTEVQI